MSKISNIINVVFSFLFPLMAAEADQGFLNIANCVPVDHACTITIMGKDLVPGGLKAAESTGWFILPAGEHAVSLQIEGYDKARGTISVKPLLSNLCVLFLELPQQKIDKDGKEILPQLRIKRYDALAIQKQHQLKVVSFCPNQVPFHIGQHSLALALYEPQEIANWNGGAFAIKHDSKVIGTCSGAQEKGSYMLLLATDHKGKFCSQLVRNEPQKLPPWMKPKP